MLLDLDAGWMHVYRQAVRAGLHGGRDGADVVRAAQLAYAGDKVTVLPGAVVMQLEGADGTAEQQERT